SPSSAPRRTDVIDFLPLFAKSLEGALTLFLSRDTPLFPIFRRPRVMDSASKAWSQRHHPAVGIRPLGSVRQCEGRSRKEATRIADHARKMTMHPMRGLCRPSPGRAALMIRIAWSLDLSVIGTAITPCS